ncbi:hypothetical protein [Actinoplanes sp. HUAS TT8]|uniref:hypothetical protein n=1 Tax=Actinoplanes sp. HUAS TT8 TaxID=3447453 RepID=UPI003F523EA7
MVMLLSAVFFSVFQRLQQPGDMTSRLALIMSNPSIPGVRDIANRERVTFAGESTITFQITLNSFDPASGQLSGNIGAVDAADNTPEGKKVHLRLISRFRPSTIEIPLSRGIYDLNTVPFDLEAEGTARVFPSDVYAIQYYWLLDDGRQSGTGANTIVIAGERLSDYELRAAVGREYLDFLLRRNRYQQGWVYTIALSPLVLLLGFVIASSRPRTNPAEVAIEAAVGILALLPLRQVLVPAYVSTFNTVDYILGFEFVLFIAWLLFVVTRPAPPEPPDRLPRDRPKERDPRPGQRWREWKRQLER